MAGRPDRTDRSNRSTRFLDGCHRYGWLINILVTLATIAYFFGGVHKQVELMDKRIGNVESLVYQILLRK